MKKLRKTKEQYLRLREDKRLKMMERKTKLARMKNLK